MTALHLVTDGAELARRRRLVPAGQLVEAWPDLVTPGSFWMGARSKALVDAVGEPLPSPVSVDESCVPIYYGPRLQDEESLPPEESLRSRVVSAHGIGVAWITIDALGERTRYEPASPSDPVFYLRRPGGSAAHVWRLFRTRDEARAYMGEWYPKDPEAREWASALPAASYDELITLDRR